MIATLLTVLIRLYQWILRPVIGANCRFTPSCSHYAIEALEQYGAVRGTWLAGRRILRCNPWSEGGMDPVPDHPGCHAQRGVSRRRMRL
jgi:putative membrane protein insertion efficiency factor